MLPEHHHDEQVDERTAETIEAFLEGPVKARRRRPPPAERPRRPIALDTRQDWTAALQHENARHLRYGRPTSVVLLRLRGRRDGPATDRTAATLADVIRAQARETDRAVRIDSLNFRLLLPETSARAARTVVERIERSFLGPPGGRTDSVDVCIEVATAARTGSLEDSLQEAEARLAARMLPT